MSEFVFLFRSSEEDRRQHMGTPEKAQKTIQAWLAWLRDLEAKGLVKSYGKPLETAGKVVRRKSVTDGPFAETKDIVLGFITVEAKDLPEAARIAQGCPFIAGEGSVEVRPVDVVRAAERTSRAE
jgi:hypothetical protein